MGLIEVPKDVFAVFFVYLLPKMMKYLYLNIIKNITQFIMSKNEGLTYMKSIYGKKKILTIPDLLNRMKVSTITVRRKLKQYAALTSYNKNGRYYTLPHIPSFNAKGLWQYQDVRFSKFGNLSQTIVGLIAGSDTGLSAEILCDYLGFAPHYILHQLSERTVIKREKLNGL
jgi:hypothetical protein